MTPLLEARRLLLSDLTGSETVDLLVVGGGINGVGVLADAVTRGLSAVLVERDDLGVGTSTRSSKLIHGGLRYLEHLDFGLVREGLMERDRLSRLAPHLLAMRRFVVPVVGGRWQLPYIGSGLTLYDLLGGRRGGRFEMFGRSELIRRVPGLDPSRVVGGFEYTDGVCDDARMVLAVAETARRHGGRILTHAVVTGFERVGPGWEVGVEDVLGGGAHVVRARSVIDVTGAFEVDEPELRSEEPLIASRGTHLVVAGDRFSGVRGMTIRVPGRVVFVIPWGRRWLVGTTDVAHRGAVDRPRATAAEVDYLLDTVNEVLDTDLGRHDIISTFAGIRPLAGEAESDTAAVSREHRIDNDGNGLVTVRGGKYTTYRLIAAAAVDEVAGFLAIDRTSVTDALPLAGASTPAVLETLVGSLVASGLDQVGARWLVGRHGTAAPEVVAAGEEHGLEGRLHPDMPYLSAEAWWAIHREGAFTLDDVLARRTRLAVEVLDHGVAAAPLVASLLAEVHGWSAAEADQARADYAVSASAEYGVP